jgi:hypothetical protein
MFELAIRYLGDNEQVKQWLPLITKCKIIENYSQTELGHGSNVRISCDVKYNAVENTNLIIIFRGLRQRPSSTKRETNLSSIHQRILLQNSGKVI